MDVIGHVAWCAADDLEDLADLALGHFVALFVKLELLRQIQRFYIPSVGAV